jgi:hypothetical protein
MNNNIAIVIIIIKDKKIRIDTIVYLFIFYLQFHRSC